MEIRAAHKEDLPEIIQLMKISLGEELMPKSEAFFRWKHEQNPFGHSIMLIAREEGKLAGFRSFMQWKWVSDNEVIKAVRAVDTATHPDFQGKGIFTKLTMRAIEEASKNGVDIVFNTPNPISKIGYLKMGWTSAGRMPLRFGLGSIFPKRLQTAGFIPEEYQMEKGLSVLGKDFNQPVNGNQYQTPLSYNYLKWRYLDCPVAEYGMLCEKDNFGMVFRLKPLRGFTELRICEFWSKAGAEKKCSRSFSELKRKIRPLLVSCGPASADNNILKLFGPFRKGPEVTIRSVHMQSLHSFNHFSSWNPSIGSLELF